jgi:hypothetical protein
MVDYLKVSQNKKPAGYNPAGCLVKGNVCLLNYVESYCSCFAIHGYIHEVHTRC